MRSKARTGIIAVLQISVALLALTNRARARDPRYEYLPGRELIVYTILSPTRPIPLYALNVTTGRERTFYQASHPVYQIRFAPKGRWLAFREGSTLRLVDYFQGKVVRSFQNVHDYAWSPQGDRIVFVTGYLEGEGAEVITPTGIYLVDLPQGKPQKVSEKGLRVAWASWNGQIYFRDLWGKAYRVDPKTKAVRATMFHGVHFSPNGELYYMMRHMDVFRIYRRATNEELQIPQLDPTRWSLASAQWSPNGKILLISKSRGMGRRTTLLHDFARNKTQRFTRIHILCFGRNSNELLARRYGKLVRLSISKIFAGASFEEARVPN